MAIQDEIRRIERAAKACDVPISELCEAGGIDRATYQRWKNGTVSPLLEKWSGFKAALPKEVVETMQKLAA